MKKEGKGEGARWKQGKGRNPFENPVRSIFLIYFCLEGELQLIVIITK